MQPVTTFTLFQYDRWPSRWWAFKQMGLFDGTAGDAPGLTFARMVGSGAGNGFSILPNLSRYGLMACWEDRAAAEAFFEESAYYRDLRRHSAAQCTVYLQPTTAHGEWEGQQPFVLQGSFDKSEPVAVLTRATIHARHLASFWRHVPSVSRRAHMEGAHFSVGIGELPLIQQATFSLWDSAHTMMSYAYKSQYHSKVVRLTREKGWYKEELFARFKPIGLVGDTAAFGIEAGVIGL